MLYRSALGKSHDDTIVLAIIACFERMASVPTGKQKSVEGSLPSPPRALVGAKGGAAEEKFFWQFHRCVWLAAQGCQLSPMPDDRLSGYLDAWALFFTDFCSTGLDGWLTHLQLDS